MWTNLAMNLVTTLAGVVAGAFIGAWVTLWVEARKGQVKWINEKTLQVAFKAIKKDRDGYYIPGEGRIDLSDELVAQAKRRKGRVAYQCRDARAVKDPTPYFVVVLEVPL